MSKKSRLKHTRKKKQAKTARRKAGSSATPSPMSRMPAVSTRTQAAGGASSTSATVGERHLDVLQNIEYALLNAHRQDMTVDDRIVRDALMVAAGQARVSDPRCGSIVSSLWK